MAIAEPGIEEVEQDIASCYVQRRSARLRSSARPVRLQCR